MSQRSFSRFTASIGLIGGMLLLLLGGLVRVGHAQQGPLSTDTTQVSFDEAIRIALDQNTNIKRAQSSASQANAEVQAEWMDFAPNLNFSTDLSRRFGRNFNQLEGEIVTQTTDFFSASISSGVTVFNGFENTASLRRARNQAQASELDVDRAQREVAFTVMDQFIALVESREQIRVRREQLEALRQQLEQTREFVDAGASPRSDLYQQQADVAEAEQQLLQAKREHEVSKTQLIQTLQLNPQGAYDFQVPELEDTKAAEDYDQSALIEEAFQNRLDLQVAKAEKRAAERGVRVARASYYPTLSIGFNYGSDWTSQRVRAIPGTGEDPEIALLERADGGEPIRYPISGTGTPPRTQTPGLWDQINDNYSGGVSLSLSLPIFDRFQRVTRVQQAQVQAQNAEYDLQDQRQQVALQVRQTYLDYKNAVQQLQAANKRLKAAEQARTATQERYNLGSASIVELRNANRDYVDAASQQIRARYNLLFQQKAIDYYVGRLDPRRPLQSAQSAQ